MIKRILIVVGIVFVIGLLILWLIRGGAAAVGRTAHTLTNPITLIFGSGTSTGGSLWLPWQPAEPTRGPDISQYADEAAQALAQIPPDEGGQEQQNDRMSQIQQFGNPSPYVGSARLSQGEARASSAAEEYVELRTSGASPIVVSGWSLQSALTGVRAYIPEGASMFIMGIVNNVRPVALQDGDVAIITSGASPVGVSFRENMCSGYLAQLRQFTPGISDECPTPSDALPETADNLRTYGGSCFDYIANLPHCSFPGTQLPSDLSSNCRAYVANTFSYNGCVNVYGARDSFALSSWRIFLNRTIELWNNSHDVIRLLDAQGRTVDVLTY